MNVVNWAVVWIAGAGAIGGALNALATDNLHLAVARRGRRRMATRAAGLAGNVMTGMGLSAMHVLSACGERLPPVDERGRRAAADRHRCRARAIALDRSPTNPDKRFLRAAV
jgi:hypothetical protein